MNHSQIRKLSSLILAGAVCLSPLHAGEGEEAGWETSIAVGTTLTRGNSETLGANVGITAQRDMDDYQFLLGAGGNYGESETVAADGTTDTVTTTQNAKALANAKRKLPGAMFLYSDNSVFHDDLAGIDLRLLAGLGAGFFVIEGEDTQLTAELGLTYLHEELAGDITDDGVLLRVASRLDHKLSETAKLWASAEYLPRTDDFGDYLLNGEAGIEAQINSSMSLRLVAQDRYDSTPPAGSEDNDLSLIGALVYTL